MCAFKQLKVHIKPQSVLSMPHQSWHCISPIIESYKTVLHVYCTNWRSPMHGPLLRYSCYSKSVMYSSSPLSYISASSWPNSEISFLICRYISYRLIRIIEWNSDKELMPGILNHCPMKVNTTWFQVFWLSLHNNLTRLHAHTRVRSASKSATRWYQIRDNLSSNSKQSMTCYTENQEKRTWNYSVNTSLHNLINDLLNSYWE